MIFIKIHKSYRNVIAICDSKLLGKKFTEGIKQLDIRESFYNGKPHSYEETVVIMKVQAQEDATFNIVGPNSIKAALEAGIITQESIGYIDNTPYALVLL
jgi:hypothetical protein